MFIAITTIWFAPGFLILSIFKGAWAVIHVDRLIKLTPVISFVFWFIAILGIRKGFLFLRKYFRKDGTPFDANEIEPIKKLTKKE